MTWQNRLNLAWAVATSVMGLLVAAATVANPTPLLVVCCVACTANNLVAWRMVD